MLRNAIRQLERRQHSSRHALDVRPVKTFYRLLSRRDARNFVAGQTAIASAHDDEEGVGIRKHDRLSQSNVSRGRAGSEPVWPRHPSTSDEVVPNKLSNSQWDRRGHADSGDHARLSTHRRCRSKTHKSGRHDRPLRNKMRGRRSDKYSRRGRRWAQAHPELLISWSKQSPNLLLKKIFENHHDIHYWERQVAMIRSNRLPIVLLQIFLRRKVCGPGGRKELLPLFPTYEGWKTLKWTQYERGYHAGMINFYLWVLQAKTDEERCERYLKRELRVPNFIFFFLVRASSAITKVATLNSLIEDCRKKCATWIENTQKGVDPELSEPESSLRSYRDYAPSDFCFAMKLLAYHCLCLEPRLVLKLADIAVEYIQGIAKFPMSPEKMYQTQCFTFNKILRIFQPQPRFQPVQRSSPNFYLWEAQRTLLAMSAGMERSLLVDQKGFQAIRHVLAGMPKNQTEMHSSLRQAPTWPPYLQPADGLDEAAEPEDSWSRVVRAGTLMQEAGFSKEGGDDALDILHGMSIDGTPTIQQRTAIAGERKMSVWEASIRATRNAHEAWERFRNPPQAHLQPGVPHYAAMFEKLVLREADTHSRALPGDKALNFPLRQESNLTEFEKARLRPPSVAQLYDRMRSDGIRPSGNCLQILVANAESLETAHRYLNDYGKDDQDVRSMFLDDPDPLSLKTIEPSLFAAYIQALTAHGSKRPGRNMMRAIRMAQSRFGLSRSPAAQVTWATILRNLSQHHGALRISLSQQLTLLSHAVEEMGGSKGVSLPIFIQFGKCIRKEARWELKELAQQLESNEEIAALNPWMRLYSKNHQSLEQEEKKSRVADMFGPRSSSLENVPDAQSPDLLFQKSASLMKKMYNSLKSQELESQQLLGSHRVVGLDRMSWRKDMTRSDHGHEYMLSLAYVGEFEEMATVVRDLIHEWSQPDVVEALQELDEAPPYADFFEVLCAFRLLAEPMIGAQEAESLQEAISSSGLGWLWPNGEAMQIYLEMQEDESILTLARVLEWIRNTRDEGEENPPEENPPQMFP